ncbi:bifunctional aspartate kinase/homoserine dehydrogenase I [Dokdonella fugitiva]|jgi:aspartokinase/homoserine dehydrogenase 1|uniref:Bifunctional aspartokinase/homoserine dehydrogenase n=1 Tax=Dokdonella fugitiva TaxID=328517 RepID=A0A4R2HYF7_9GAMM|nr:bifunctional aspartate kinase/homoserine dehydrogenase I [Dokdonella fugitiva]MBA8885335.1 aspartokinase/homoserine dehydrogenase 1 [Dokdonella fugitiva]TCO36594.1 aspartate kinase [Dokdonella fugitiva]
MSRNAPALPAAAVPAAAASCAAHKFGGSSLANASCFCRVAAILAAQPGPQQLVVVSAMRGTTDALIALADAAVRGDGGWKGAHAALRERHLAATRDLLGDDADATLAWLDHGFTDLANLLAALAVLGTPSREAAEAIQGLGEVWSARMLSDFLTREGHDCACLDARDVLVVGHGELGAVVDWETSSARYADWRARHPPPWLVVTGFVARTREGRATVLGRNGSDYSAAIFAALAGASELTLWGDTDGVLSADPRLVPDAVPLAALSYDEACELAYFGAKVIHPQTLTPVIARGLPVRIRNTFRPEHAGTAIGGPAEGDAPRPPVKGLSVVRDLAVLTLEGAGMIGVPGTAERAFGALHAASVSVVMISQGSSEHSICCVVREADSARAEAALRRAFVAELARGEIASVGVAAGISVLAAVGDGMAGQPGVAARLFGALARCGINIRAIAQGASERNISVAVDAADTARALRAAHAAFWLSPQTVSIGLVGPGKVGAALLAQLEAARARLLREHQLDLRVRAVATRGLLWLGEADGAAAWQDRASEGGDLDAFTRHVQAEHLPHALVVDCSASDAVAARYADWLAAGIHVVTPNKHAGAGPRERWQAIRAASARGARFRYEATVGAGLPVISTLRDLLDTGDELLAAEGIFSGTLAWLFNRYDGSVPFSALVHEAHALGYTEPDPRDDLSGTDVARKLVILAREAGVDLDLADVAVESLVPASLRAASVEEFMHRLSEFDAAIAARHARTRDAGRVLRYVARLDRDGRASVGLDELPADHAFAHLRLTDNIVQFSTRRYRDNPLVVQGPGAGPEVTAAGVFADVLRVAATLGARL